MVINFTNVKKIIYNGFCLLFRWSYLSFSLFGLITTQMDNIKYSTNNINTLYIYIYIYV